MSPSALADSLERALAARHALFDEAHLAAFRLFNGFTEGCADLVIDLYGTTAVFSNYADAPKEGQAGVDQARRSLEEHLPWLHAGIQKTRNGRSQEERRGRLLFGAGPDRKIREHAIWYAVDLTMNQDASFYLDTRNLRAWALHNLGGRTVLNAFAYTGSLGVAAACAGASRVVQLDRNRKFMDVAARSCALNGIPVQGRDFIAGDFFRETAKFRHEGQRFDCVIIDPPFFASFPTGTIDQLRHSARLINKVRPLVNAGGYLVAVNNSLFVSGRAYMETLESLCSDGYLRIAELIPVPEDFIGYSKTSSGLPITNPAPFSHSTKIAVLEVKRK